MAAVRSQGSHASGGGPTCPRVAETKETCGTAHGGGLFGDAREAVEDLRVRFLEQVRDGCGGNDVQGDRSRVDRSGDAQSRQRAGDEQPMCAEPRTGEEQTEARHAEGSQCGEHEQ